MPECKFRLGSVQEFKLQYNDRFYSKTYIVKSKQSNVFDIVITTKYPLVNYRLMKNAEIKILNSKVLIYSEGNAKKSRAAGIKLFKIDQ